jgi:hypothetical protein
MRPNDFLMWNVICWAHRNGYKYFDFGGGGKQGVPYGVRDYKMKYGCEIEDYGRYIYTHRPLAYKAGKLGVKMLSFPTVTRRLSDSYPYFYRRNSLLVPPEFLEHPPPQSPYLRFPILKKTQKIIKTVSFSCICNIKVVPLHPNLRWREVSLVIRVDLDILKTQIVHGTMDGLMTDLG